MRSLKNGRLVIVIVYNIGNVFSTLQIIKVIPREAEPQQESGIHTQVCLPLFVSVFPGCWTLLTPILCQGLGLRSALDDLHGAPGPRVLPRVGNRPPRPSWQESLREWEAQGRPEPRQGYRRLAGAGKGSSLAFLQVHSEPTQGKPRFCQCRHAWGASIGDIKY